MMNGNEIGFDRDGCISRYAASGDRQRMTACARTNVASSPRLGALGGGVCYSISPVAQCESALFHESRSGLRRDVSPKTRSTRTDGSQHARRNGRMIDRRDHRNLCPSRRSRVAFFPAVARWIAPVCACTPSIVRRPFSHAGTASGARRGYPFTCATNLSPRARQSSFASECPTPTLMLALTLIYSRRARESERDGEGGTEPGR